MFDIVFNWILCEDPVHAIELLDEFYYPKKVDRARLFAGIPAPQTPPRPWPRPLRRVRKKTPRAIAFAPAWTPLSTRSAAG